jgi:hypothetical protein
MYVCRKGYYNLPDTDIMLNCGYPFGHSRNRIITQQQSPQTLATGARPKSIISSSHHNLFQTAFQYYGPLTFQVFTTLLYTGPLPPEHARPSFNCVTNSTRTLPLRGPLRNLFPFPIRSSFLHVLVLKLHSTVFSGSAIYEF